MCLVEVWTFSECGCRFDHYIPCHPIFSGQSSPARARHGQIQPLPATPPPSRSAKNEGCLLSYADWADEGGGTRKCSVRHIEHRVFRDPICDDCLLDELGLKNAEKIVDSVEDCLDGEEWLLESNIEIQIDEASITAQRKSVGPEDFTDDMPTTQVGTGFESIDDGDADDEGELEVILRGRSNRRSAIDISRENFGVAGLWPNCNMKQETISDSNGGECYGRSKMATSLVRKVKGSELGSIADKAKRGLRLTIERAKSTASKTRRDMSQSPMKNTWDSASSCIRTPRLITKVRSVVQLKGLPNDNAARIRPPAGRRSALVSQEGLNALPDVQNTPINQFYPLVSSVSIPPKAQRDSHITTPTSIASSAAYDIASSSPVKWEDHLRKDIGEKAIKPAVASSLIAAGNKFDVPFDVEDEGRRSLSTNIRQSGALTISGASSGNWTSVTNSQKLGEERAGIEVDQQDDRNRFALTTAVHCDAHAAGNASPAIWSGSTREISTADMENSIPNSARPFGHAHKPSASSVTSFATALSHSPQTSPPRPSPRMHQNVSFRPLATMLQVTAPKRPNSASRDSSLQSPPLRTLHRLGLQASPMPRSPASASMCVHEYDCCAICESHVGEARIMTCICERVFEDSNVECHSEKAKINKAVGMEVCDQCAGQH